MMRNLLRRLRFRRRRGDPPSSKTKAAASPRPPTNNTKSDARNPLTARELLALAQETKAKVSAGLRSIDPDPSRIPPFSHGSMY